MDGAQAEYLLGLLESLIEGISGPQLELLTEYIPAFVNALELVQGVIMSCCGCLIGWLAGNELLRCLW